MCEGLKHFENHCGLFHLNHVRCSIRERRCEALQQHNELESNFCQNSVMKHFSLWDELLISYDFLNFKKMNLKK